MYRRISKDIQKNLNNRILTTIDKKLLISYIKWQQEHPQLTIRQWNTLLRMFKRPKKEDKNE